MKKTLLLIVILLTLTGCVKMEVNMEIRKDKSMTLGIIQAINKSLMNEGYSTTDILEAEEKNNLEEKGFKIESYSDNEMEGYKITKEIKNIDKVSTEKEITTDLALDKMSENEYMFIVKKGLFKNTYKAILKNSDTDELNNSLNDGLTDNSEPDDVIEDDEEILFEEDEFYDTDITEDEYYDYDIDMTEEDTSSDSLDDFDYSSLMSGMEINFKVNLPYKALNNNATSVENDGKTLTWDLMTFKEEIKFEFELYNTTNIIIASASGILLIAIIITLIITKRKKNKKVSNNNNEVPQTNETIMEQQNITSSTNDVQETNVIEQPNDTSNSIEVQEQSNITDQNQSQTINNTNSFVAQPQEVTNIEQPTNSPINNTNSPEIVTTNNFIDTNQIMNNLEQMSNPTINNTTTQEPIPTNNSVFEQTASMSFQSIINASSQQTQEQPQVNNNIEPQTNNNVTITPLEQPMNLEQIGATQSLQPENQQPQDLNTTEKLVSQYDSILPTNTDN